MIVNFQTKHFRGCVLLACSLCTSKVHTAHSDILSASSGSRYSTSSASCYSISLLSRLRPYISRFQHKVDLALADSLQNLSMLQSVKLDGCQVTCSGLKAVGNWCVSLKELSLSKCLGVTDEGLSSLITKHKDLQMLDITCCRKITHVSLAHITNSCTSLVSLKMESCTSVSAEAFVLIGQRCQLLEELDLTDNEIDDEGLKSITRCSQLSSMKLGICLNITDEVLHTSAFPVQSSKR